MCQLRIPCLRIFLLCNVISCGQAYARAHPAGLRVAGGVLRHRTALQATLLRGAGFGLLGQGVHVCGGGDGEQGKPRLRVDVENQYFLDTLWQAFDERLVGLLFLNTRPANS